MDSPSSSETLERGKGPGTPAPRARPAPVGIDRPSTVQQREIDLSPLEQEIVEVIDGIDEKVMQQVEEATEISKASPTPSLELIEKDVWADGGVAWRN
mgnify:CR=1 FL=1